MAKGNSFFKLEMLVLQILERGECYGYEIGTTIKKQTNGVIDINTGTLYPILYKLTDAGYISSKESKIGRKLKIFYKLEPKGKELLNQLKENYYSWTIAIDYCMSDTLDNENIDCLE
ncbi:PadR family transcriptional regulator [[Clostridium] innocuum]|uniref:PadR family transcriptional regulator n=1 Tax=Clostridium innocuum TaxID=1522 RepID=UPI000D6ADCAF|nr:PadR family transcriptional regulator [[Clostridium] innocuum]MCR0316600.1 PadR family transcriptional regulator [[Clostridium] innocuum]MCR0371934.1 PadR family transcriptional regulator [[Clostridium] innocuum]MCR0375999.1 PadR family transcriptional regulator [[Clostridium] innocuum]MCR0561250.1 PadR family transcriptional regulator [[Clostridium] innocuum]MCR0604544.1 PadR family transcriptional regulator [[Clostridium] innocuum]